MDGRFAVRKGRFIRMLFGRGTGKASRIKTPRFRRPLWSKAVRTLLAAILLFTFFVPSSSARRGPLAKATKQDVIRLFDWLYDKGGDDNLRHAVAVFLGVVKLSAEIGDAPPSPSAHDFRRVGERKSTLEQFSSIQPVEPVRILFAPASGAAPLPNPVETLGLRPFPSVAYVLNVARSQLVNGQLQQGPDLLDVVDLNADSGSEFLRRIDLSSDLSAYVEPQDMALSPDGATMAVAVRGSDPRVDASPPVESHIAIADLAAGQRDRRIFLPASTWPSGIVFSPEGDRVYVLASQRQQADLSMAEALVLLTIGLESGEVLNRLELPFENHVPGDLVITPDGGMLVARTGGALYEIDTATGTIAAKIPTFTPQAAINNSSLKLAMSPFGNEVYAEGRKPGGFPIGVAVIDVARAAITEVFEVPNARGGTRQDVGVTDDARILTHMDSLSGLLSYIDRLTGEVIGQIDSGGPIFQGAIAEEP